MLIDVWYSGLTCSYTYPLVLVKLLKEAEWISECPVWFLTITPNCTSCKKCSTIVAKQSSFHLNIHSLIARERNSDRQRSQLLINSIKLPFLIFFSTLMYELVF